MRKTKRKMDYTDFTVCASDLGSLFGCFGPHAQYRTFCKIWGHSTFKATCQFTQAGSMEWWQQERSLLERLGIASLWQQLLSQADCCDTQEQLRDLEDQAFTALFQSDAVKELITPLSAEAQIRVLALVDAHDVAHIKALTGTFSRNAKEEGLLRENILEEQIMQLLGHCASLWSTLKSRAGRNYGIRGEKRFKALYNIVHARPLEVDTKTHSVALSQEFCPESTSCSLEARIDGLRDGNIVEIKHRTGRLCDELPVYDRFQLHTYMFVLQKAHILAVECVQTTLGTFCKETRVEFDQAFWHGVLLRLKRCLEFIKELHTNQLAREFFFLLEETSRATVITNHLA